MCPLAEALDAAMLAVGKPSVHWQDARTIGIEAFAGATEELVAVRGALNRYLYARYSPYFFQY